MNRPLLVVLLISGILLVAVIPLKNTLSKPSTDVDSSLELRPKYVPGELIIRFKRETTEEEIFDLEVEQEAQEVYASPFTLARRWRAPPSKTFEELADFFDKHPLVEYAEPNYYVYASTTPNDPGYSYQWHLDNVDYGGIHMEAAWDIETGDPNIVVAVVDSGVAYEDYPAPPHWHVDTYNAYSGHSWWCGVSEAPSSWSALYGTDPTPPGYGNGWKEYLQHSFNLTAATGTVTFYYRYRHHLENTYDYAYVEVSSDNGLTWDQLKSYTGPRIPALVKWRADSVDLSGYKGSNILIRFRVYSDEIYSDEDGAFNSDGALFVDEIELEDASGTIFYDDVESGAGAWETTQYEQAPDLSSTSFWINSDEVPGDGIDNDGNGYVDDVNGWDFVNSDAHPNDDEAHGTHVAGTVAQTTNNNLGVAGVAFGTTIMPVKVLNAAGTGTYQQVADGIYYAVNNGADIINLSLGGSDPSATLEDAVAYAYNNGVTVFAASGNGNDGSCDYPAAYDAYVIAVGATQYDETRAPYSNYGSSLDIVAPGGNTGVDQNGDGYADGVLQNTFSDTTVDWAYWFYQGTSMSTPHASGLAALLLARNPTLTPDWIRNVLESTAEDLGDPGRDDTCGWGLIDAQAALQSVRAYKNIQFVAVAYNSSIMSYPEKSMSPYGPEVSPVYNLVKQALAYLNPENPDNPLSNIVMPGDVVVLKPNLVSPSGFAKEGCTRTAVLRPLVDFAVEAGASKVIIAEGSASPDPEDVVFGPDYSNITGLAQALQEMYPSVNITYINLNQDQFTWVDLGENSTFYGDYAADQLYSLYNIRMDEDSYYYAEDSTGYNPKGYRPGLYAIGNTVFEADVFIDVPKMKVHHLTGVTLSMKNLVGITVSSTGNTTNEESIKDIPHWNNSASHYSETLSREDSFENDVLWRIMADLNKIVFYADKNGVMNSTRQRRYLSVVDGVIGMEGPTVYNPPAIPRPTGVIVAGENPAAVDAVCSRVMGFNYTVLKSITSMEKVSDHQFGIADPTLIAVLGTALTSDTFGESYVPHKNYEDDRIAPYKIRLQHFDPPEAEVIETSPEAPMEGEETNVIVYTQNVDLVAAGWLRYSLDDAGSTIIKMVPNEESVIGNLGMLEGGTGVSYYVCLQDYFFNTGWSDMLFFEVLPLARVLIPLGGWSVDSRYTNADYDLNSNESSIFLELNATDINSRVTIRNLNVPKLNLTTYDYVDVEVEGSGNAKILMRFFLDDGSCFDVAYWKDPTTLNAATFDLTPYAGRTLRGDAYIALKSSDGTTSNVTITEISFVDV